MQSKDKLKSDLIFSAQRLSEIVTIMPEKLRNIKITDSSGKDEQNIFQVVNSIISKFNLFADELDSPFKIAVVGSQGTGKSTIVNLLLGESLMPSTTLENESAVIKLSYPNDTALINQAVFELLDGSNKQTSIEQANILIDKNQRNIDDDLFVKSIKYVTFYIDNPQLKQIELINTPGMNVITDDFYPKVKHLFNEADIILWVNSKEQILDSFNSWLIKKIHADNDKIVGLITFPDNLYRQDEISGVTDVVTQFMEKLEDGKLIRVNDKIGLFIFNGKFAQIAESHKANLKFINDVEDLDEDEDKLKMLYNFLHHGFAYSDDPKNIKILIEHNLYGLEDLGNQSGLNNDFNTESFYKYCLDNGFCQFNNDDNSASYTDKGRQLLGEASQYYSFGRFSEDVLIPMSEKSKSETIKTRIARMLSITESKDSSISRLLKVKKQLELKKNSLEENEQNRIADFNNIIKILKFEYGQWYNNQIDFETNTYSEAIIDIIISKIENEIDAKDFLKEIKNTLTPKWMKSSDESPVSKKIAEIATNAIELIMPEKIEKLAIGANVKIEFILLNLEKEFLSKKHLSNNKNSFGISFTTNLDTSIILKKITQLLKPLLKKMMINLAKKDLRKGANTFIKKNIVKPIIILIRKLLTKMGINFAKKKAASAATKAGMGPIGWALLCYDVYSTADDIHNMYKEMKVTLKQQLKDEPSFREGFKEEAINTYKNIIDTVIFELNNDFFKNQDDISFIIDGINSCENILTELERFRVNEFKEADLV